MRRLLLPLVALLVAGTATFAARAWLERRDSLAVAAAPEPVLRKAVLVAAADLAVGSFVLPDSMRWQDWPDVAVPETYLVRGQGDETQFVGAVVRRPLTVGQPLSAGSVVKPGERGFLAAVLEPGMRAISVPVDEAAGNAGLIFPGDRVDLILTQTLSAEGEPAGDATGERDRARGSAGHRHGTPADQRRYRRGFRRQAGAHGHARGHARSCRENRARGRAGQARPEPAQPRHRRCRACRRLPAASSPGMRTPARRCGRRTSPARASP